MALQPTRTPRLALLVLLLEQPALAQRAVAQVTQEPPPAPLPPLPLAELLAAPQMQEPPARPLELPPAPRVMLVPPQVRRTRRRPTLLQLRLPRPRSRPRSTS